MGHPFYLAYEIEGRGRYNSFTMATIPLVCGSRLRGLPTSGHQSHRSGTISAPP